MVSRSPTAKAMPMLKFIPYLRLAPYAAMALLALVAALQWQSARHWQKRYIGAEKAIASTVAAYTGAQIAAAELNRAKVAQIKREYQVAGQKAEAEHEKLIATNRANLAGWLRTNAANQRPAKDTGTGSAATMPGEVVPSGEAPDVFATVPISDLEIVADAYAQLVALIEWAKAVGKVR